MTNEEFQKAIFAKLEKMETNQTKMQKTQVEMLKTQIEMQENQAEMLKTQIEMQENQAEMLKTQIEMQENQAEIQRKLDVIYVEVAGLLEFRTEILENRKSINEMLGDHELAIKTLKRKIV